MRQTKKLTLSAMMTALGAVFLTLGAFVEVLDLSASVIASLILVFVYLEIGSPYTYLVWLSTSLIIFLFFPGSYVWLEYLLVFGIFPVVKGYIERLPKLFWLLLKLLYANATLSAMLFLWEKLFGVPFFSKDALYFKIGIYVILNIAFLAYDMFLTVAVRIYFHKLRHRIKQMLK